MEQDFYHTQLFGAPCGISFQGSQQAENYDAEPELRCPNCECETLAAEHCIYCGFNLVDWSLSMTQSISITETMAEMRNEKL